MGKINSDGLRVSVVKRVYSQHFGFNDSIDQVRPGELWVRLGRTWLVSPSIHIRLSRPGFELRTADDVTTLQHWAYSSEIPPPFQSPPIKGKVLSAPRVQALRFRIGRTAHRGSRGIALPFHDHGTRRGWGVSVTTRPIFTPRKDPVPIVQEAGWAPGPVWTGAENLAPPRDSILGPFSP